MNPVALIRRTIDGDETYDSISLWCPGCQHEDPQEPGRMVGGLHMLPVTHTTKHPVWEWNGDLVNVTLSPSILTRTTRGENREEFICHSFLRDGQWQFLGDCTHALANQTVAMVPLPDWVVR